MQIRVTCCQKKIHKPTPECSHTKNHRNTRPPKLNLQNLPAIHDDGSCNEERPCDGPRNFSVLNLRRRKLRLNPCCKLPLILCCKLHLNSCHRLRPRPNSYYKLCLNGPNPRRKLRRKLRFDPGLESRVSPHLHRHCFPHCRLCFWRAVPLCIDELCTNIYPEMYHHFFH